MKAVEGQTALVTGGAKRLGRTIALTLAEAGANVVVHYRTSETDARSTVDALQAKGVFATAIQADLATPGAASDLYERAVEQAGPISILINNASIFQAATLAKSSEEELQTNIQLHATTPLQLARCMATADGKGSIVNLLDTRVAWHDPVHGAYCLSKRILAQQTAMLAVELAPAIRVNAVAPGPILPPPGADASVMRKLGDGVPLKRTGQPEDIADAVLFLTRSAFITGQILFVDGGAHLTRA